MVPPETPGMRSAVPMAKPRRKLGMRDRIGRGSVYVGASPTGVSPRTARALGCSGGHRGRSRPKRLLEGPEPVTDLRALLVGWLEYQRHEFMRKLRDLTPEQLVAWSVPSVELSVLGLVRHMQQEEHFFLTWGLGGGERVETYGVDDFAGGSVETVEEDLTLYLDEVVKADAAIAEMPTLDTPGRGHGQPLGPMLVKMIDEYAPPCRQGSHAAVARAGGDEALKRSPTARRLETL